ncbi:rhodanese-like domain-containing protein [Desulfovulcanus sp.]
MNRIVIIGHGFVAYKFVTQLKKIAPKIDVLWLDEYSDKKYPLPLLSQLVQGGEKIENWSRSRAKLKVGFDNFLLQRGVKPTLGRKIQVNAYRKEVTILTNMGHNSYQFDKLVIIPKLEVYPPAYAPEEQILIWPEQSCIQYFIDHFDELDELIVVGNDLALVQVLLIAEKKFVWIREDKVFFEPELEFYLEEHLKEKGVELRKVDKIENWSDRLTQDEAKKLVVFSGRIGCDERWSKNFCFDLDQALDQLSQDLKSHLDDIFLIPVIQDRELFLLQYNKDYLSNLAQKLARSFIEGTEVGLDFMEIFLFQTGSKEFTKAGLGLNDAMQKGFQAEFVVCAGYEDMWQRDEYVAKMVVDKKTRQILGFQMAGSGASRWTDLASIYINSQTKVDDILKDKFLAKGLKLNPLQRLARMVLHKMEPGILGITPQELLESKKDGTEFFLLDVRSTQEWELGRLPGAYNIPLNELKKRVMEIPRFTPLVIYSHGSGRAYEAAKLLANMGAKQLYVIDGGYRLWPYVKDEEEKRTVYPFGGNQCSLCGL